jgi:uncharacterized protein (DUF885 family)
MKRFAAALALCCLACSTTRPAGSSAALARIADDYWHHQVDQSPYLQIKLGIPTQHLPDPSYAQAERDAEFARTQLHRLESIDSAGLNGEERITLAKLRWNNERTIAALPLFYYRFPVTPYATPIRGVNQIFSTFQFKSPDDATRYLRLLNEYVRFIEQISAVISEEQRRGVLLPRDEIVAVRGMLQSYKRDTAASVFNVADGRLGSLSEAQRTAFKDQLNVSVGVSINGALQRLSDFLSAQYQEAAPVAVGLAQYPGGLEAYRSLVRLHTTLDLTPEEIHQLGLREVERINAEMQQVRDTLGFKGTKAEFHQFLKTDPRFFARTADEIGQRLTAYIHKIEPHIPEFFTRLPKASYDVQRLAPALEPSMTFGYYQPPTAVDPVGHYFYNGSRLNERNLLFAPALMAHELIPGHHFQIVRQNENEQLPPFRRQDFSDTAFVEGWGEYAAALGNDMGIYADPYDHYGRLMMDMLLSVRLVVDTGMNALGWSRDRAAEFMRDNTLLSETEIATETLRYAVDVPGQALAYKIGSLKMMELRRKAQQTLGPRFDIRQFHEWVIGSGAMPLRVLEQHVNEETKTK